MTDLESANLNLWKESLATSIYSFFGVASDVIHVFILVRFLTQDQVGLFFICYAFLYFFSQIPRGFGIAIRKKLAEINNGRSEYLWIGFLLIIPSMLGLFAAFWFGQPVLRNYASIQIPTGVIIALFFATMGFGVLEFSRYYVAGCGKPALAEKLRTGIAKTTMPVITVVFLYFNASVSYALYAVFVAYFGTAIIIFTFSERRWIQPNKDTIIEVLKFSKWSIPTSMLNDFYRRFDTLLLGALVGTIAVSYYDSSLRIAFLTATFAVGISKASNVKMSGMREAGEDVSDIAEKTMLAAPVLLIPMLLITIFNSEYILRVMYSPEYVAAKWYLILLVVVEIFQGYRLQFESVFNSYDKPRATTKTSLLSVIVNVITAPFLVFQFGGLGVIYSTLLSEVVRIVAYEIQVNRLMGDYIMPKSVYLQYLCGLLICGVIAGLDKLLISSNIVLFGVTLVLSTVGLYGVQYAIIDDFRVIIDSVLD